MKRTLTLFAVAMSALLLTAMKAEKPKKIIFFGDSITELGVKPGGYITLAGEELNPSGKTPAYELIGAGVSGNKVYDLYLRLEKDVLVHKPDVVVIFVGVNDVWHKQSFGTGTDPDKFRLFYAAIIEKIRAAGARVILCTPAVIGEKTDYSNQQDGDLNAYSNIIRSLAASNQCDLIDLRRLFHEYNLKHNPDNKESGILTYDRVHLNKAGNELVAREMVAAIR
ncbi:MAG TPA: GDSL-type esterase/lipase family protein [Sphingobacteriaceae bacterium]